MPARPARGHALLVLPVLSLFAAGLGVYLYESNRMQELSATADTSASAASSNSTDTTVTDVSATTRDGRPTDVPLAFGENAAPSNAEPHGRSDANASDVSETRERGGKMQRRGCRDRQQRSWFVTWQSNGSNCQRQAPPHPRHRKPWGHPV